MLSGLQTQIDTLFPSLRGVLPSDDELKAGNERLQFGKLVKISGYETRIFDMHDSKARASYAKLMRDLSTRIQMASVRILVNDRQIMTRKDGTTGWFRYLEWMEFERAEADGSVVTKAKQEKRS